MSKEEKRFIRNATWALRGMLLLVFLLSAAVFYVALFGNNDDIVNPSNPEVQNEEAEDQTFPVIPTGSEHSVVPVSGVSNPPVVDTSCLLVKADNGNAPAQLNIDNTIRISEELCLSFIMGITEAVRQGLLEPKDLLYHTL